MAGRAASRNIPYPDLALSYAAAGPCTRMYFYEAAAVNVACVTAGYGGVQTALPAKGVLNNGITPLEARSNAEMAYAATGMKADQASELVNRLLEKYEDRIVKAPKSKPYQECYDLQTRKPSQEYVQLHGEVKEELAQIGVTFRF